MSLLMLKSKQSYGSKSSLPKRFHFSGESEELHRHLPSMTICMRTLSHEGRSGETSVSLGSIHILALLPRGCVPTGKSHHLSEPSLLREGSQD